MSSSLSSSTTPSPSDQKAFVVGLLNKDKKASKPLQSYVGFTRRLLLEQAPDEKVQDNLDLMADTAAELLNKWCKDEPEKSLPPWFKQELDTLTQSKSLQDLEQLRSLLSRTQHVREDKEVVACIFLPSAMRDGAWLREESIEDEEQNGTGPLPVEGSVSAFHDQEFIGGLHMAFLETVINVYEPLYLKQIDEDGDEISDAPKEGSPSFHPGAYGRIIHMVQSSGTGKSRLFNELIKVVPGLSICIRPLRPGSGRHGAYPFGDDPVTTFLRIPRSPAERQVAASLFIGFLLRELATAKVVSVDEKQFWTEWSVKKPDDRHATSIVEEREERGESDAAQHSPAALRRRFFFRVLQNVNSELKELAKIPPGDAMSPLDSWAKALRDDAHVKLSQARDKESFKLTGLEALSYELCDRYCEGPARLLAERINRASPKPEGQDWDQEFLKKTFFLAIDEASTLARPISGSSRPGCVQLTHLRRALFALSSRQRELRIWTVLMDTYSGITELVDKTEPSARNAELGNLPLWSRFAWDVFAKPSTSVIHSSTGSASLEASDAPKLDRPEDLVTLKRLSQYGRPLWGVTHRPANQVLFNAVVKLLCGRVFEQNNKDHVVAVWSHRVWLEFIVPHESYELVKAEEVALAKAKEAAKAAKAEAQASESDASEVKQGDINTAANLSHASREMTPSVETVNMVNKLLVNGVRTHMRLFQNLQPSGFINSMTYSEPMLAVAALDTLRSVDSAHYEQSLLNLLNDVLQTGKLLDRGQVGEFVCRLALILARDATAGGQLAGDADHPHVPLFETTLFLKKLLGDSYGLPRAASSQLEKYVGDSVMSFTHFAVEKRPFWDANKDHVDDTIHGPIEQDVLRGWFSRTQAVQCSQQQPGIDVVLPVYFPSKKSFSYLGISVKLRNSASVPGYKLLCTRSKDGIKLRSLTHIFWGPTVRLADGSLERPLTVLMDCGVQPKSIEKRVTLDKSPRLVHNTSKGEIDALKGFAADLLNTEGPVSASGPSLLTVPRAIEVSVAHQKGGACNCDFAVLHVRGFFGTLSVLSKFEHVREVLQFMMDHESGRHHDTFVDKYVYKRVRDVELI